MEQISGTQRRQPVVKLVFAGMATVAVSALGAAATLPSRPATMAVLPVAAIDESRSTIGFSDSDLYFMTPAQVDQQLDEMQALGVNNVRVLIPWAGVEPYQGYFNWGTTDYMIQAADARGMGVLGVLNSTPTWAVDPGVAPISGRPSSPTAYGDFAGLVAARYAGKVGAYEIWNEPNGASFYSPKPDPAGYTDLLKAAYPEIKSADPDAVVIGGVTGAGVDFGDFAMNPVSFVQGIYAAGGEQYFDALSYHPYQYTTPFSQGGYLPDSPINQVAAMRDLMVANGDSDKLIWASEYGEPTSVASEADQAAYLQDMLTTWRTLGYTGPSFVYTVQDRATGSTDPEDTFGVIRSDGTPKPAAYVIQALATSPATTPTTARMALAMPEAAEASRADLAALTKVAEPTGEPAVEAGTAQQMATATAYARAAVDASVASRNPLAVAATTVAAASQLAVMTVQVTAAMAATALTPPPAASAAKLAPKPAKTPEADQAEPAKTEPAKAEPAKTPKKDRADAPKAPKEDRADAPKRSADRHGRSDGGDHDKPRHDRKH